MKLSIKDHHDYMFKIDKSIVIIGDYLLLKSSLESLNISINTLENEFDLLISLNQSDEDNIKYQKLCEKNKVPLIVSHVNNEEMVCILDTDYKKSYPKFKHSKYQYMNQHFRDSYIVHLLTNFFLDKKYNDYFSFKFPELATTIPKVCIRGDNIARQYLENHLKNLKIDVTDKDYSVICSIEDDNMLRHENNTLAIQKQVKLIQGSIVKTSGNVQCMIPHKTNLYQDNTIMKFNEPLLCVIENHPTEINHIVPWVKDKIDYQFNELIKIGIKYLKDRDYSENEKQLKYLFIDHQIDTLNDCIQEAINLWYEWFYDPIEQLLEYHPKDDPYWVGRNCPNLVDFDIKDLNNMEFIISTVKIFCDIHDINYPADHLKILEFKRKIKESDKKLSEIESIKLNSINIPIEYFTIVTNIRAKTFNIKPSKSSNVNIILNKIVPKSIGAIHLMCGLIGFNLLAIKNRNYHINYTINDYEMSSIVKLDLKGNSFDVWDKITFSGDLKMGKLIKRLEKQLGTKEPIEMILYDTKDGNNRCIYGMNKLGDKKRLNKTMRRILGKTEDDLDGRVFVLDVLVDEYDLPVIECNFV